MNYPEYNPLVNHTFKALEPVVSRRLESLPASSSNSTSFLFPLSLRTGLLSIPEGAGEDGWLVSGRAGAAAGLPELVRFIPGVIIGGRATETDDPFCLFAVKEGRWIVDGGADGLLGGAGVGVF